VPLLRFKGEVYKTSVITWPVGCARGLHFPGRGRAGPNQPVPRRAGPCTGGQPTVVRERSTTECGRADPSRTLRGVEQSADEQLRHLYYTPGVPLRRDGLPPSAASHHRRRTATRSQLPSYMVPHAERGMEDQGVNCRRARLWRWGLTNYEGVFGAAAAKASTRRTAAPPIPRSNHVIIWCTELLGEGRRPEMTNRRLSETTSPAIAAACLITHSFGQSDPQS